VPVLTRLRRVGTSHEKRPFDHETGNVVRPALLWNDNRSAGSAGALVEELGGGAAWADAVGSVPVSSFTASKLS
jgi:sugar (pentulose or hexulose) kinase